MGTTTTSPNNHHNHHQYLTANFLSKSIYILIPLALLHFYLFPLPINLKTHPPLISPKPHPHPHPHLDLPPLCNYTEGQWVPSPSPPLYNDSTCSTIKPGQNCLAHGRPDTRYLHWRWQPASCSLRPFRPLPFLRLLRHKHLAFVGDSLARNQLESLLCLLSSSSSSKPVLRSASDDNKFRRWALPDFNATISVYWSPFLVHGDEKSDEPTGPNYNRLYLDRANPKWADELAQMDIVLFSVGHWFLHRAIFLEDGAVLGCHQCTPEFNHTEMGFFDVFRKAVRTALKEVAKFEEKIAVVTTFSPAHFEGEWDKAGACDKKEPYREKEMEYMDGEMRRIEVEEVAAAAVEGRRRGTRRRGTRFVALDVTRLALLRPDGHPGPYMNPNPFGDGVVRERVQNDCVHWCLPGPVDTWNEILAEVLERLMVDERNEL